MRRRIVAIWVSLAMVLSLIVIIVDIATVVEAPTIIYVDDIPGIGPGNPAENYTSIQDAINASSDGDTVFVYNGTYYENVIVNRGINLTGEDRNYTIIDGGGIGNTVLITSHGVHISGFSITNCSDGVNYDAGVRLDSANNCLVINNIFLSNKRYGMYLTSSSYNTVKDNYITTSSSNGVSLKSSSNNDIINNIIFLNGANGIVPVSHSNNNMISDNEVFSNGGNGIHLSSYADNNFIVQNKVFDNKDGIYISYGSNNNIVTDNNVSSNNVYGIMIENSFVGPSTGNKVYHNDIMYNANQGYDDQGGNYWDNGYPSGGNYWSDYGGVDNFMGPDQDQLGSDGIGDTEYIVDSGTFDHYPLMGPSPYKPIENYTILKLGWNLISIPMIQSDPNLSKVLETIDGYYDAVQWYDNSDLNDPWKHHKVGKSFGNDLFEIYETMGLWVHITKPGDTIFFYNGTQPTSNQTISLHPGWNLVGYPSLSNKVRDNALNNLTFGVEVDMIWSYNSTTQNWKEMTPSGHFELFMGYWIHATTECVWEVPL